MKHKNQIPRKKKEEIEEIIRNYRKMLKEIKPFIKKQETKECSTVGKWKVSS